MKRKMHYNEAQNIKLARQLIAKEMHGEAADEEEDCEEDEEEDEDNEDDMQDECKTDAESGEPWDSRGKTFSLGWLGWSPLPSFLQPPLPWSLTPCVQIRCSVEKLLGLCHIKC